MILWVIGAAAAGGLAWALLGGDDAKPLPSGDYGMPTDVSDELLRLARIAGEHCPSNDIIMTAGDEAVTMAMAGRYDDALSHYLDALLSQCPAAAGDI